MTTYESQFSPYAPPPDSQQVQQSLAPSRFKRPWFPANASSQQVISYQSGAVPTFENSYGGVAATPDAVEDQVNQWETRFGMRVDVLAAFAYIIGPLSALLLLVLETQNDYVRFHAYQSALITTPLLVARMLISLLGFPAWFRTFFTICTVLLALYMSFRAFVDASRDSLARYGLPIIGAWAEIWVSNE